MNAFGTSVTRYQFDDTGVLQSTSLPDGSQVAYERNGQGQLVEVKRERILTSWLRWAAPAQTIVKDLQRDIVGLKRYTTGNGIEAEFQRSRDGSLARVVYLQTRAQPAHTAANSPPVLLGHNTQETIALLLGISPAHAATTPETSAATESSKPNPLNAAPGALDLPQDPRAFMDHRYLWDARGNLLHTQSSVNQSPTQDSYAYDGKDRLVAAVSPKSVSRYFYDAANRRVLRQQGIQRQDDTRSNTLKTSYQPGTHRWAGNVGESSTDSKPATYDANGQPQALGQREYVWDALGKLIAIREQDKTLASYRYNHRSERIAKTVDEKTQSFLYDNQQLIGELNAQGQLTRQYLYLADQPIAAIDTPEGQTLHSPDTSTIADIVHDLQTIVSVWFSTDTIVWLHTNHLGATEAATDATGKLVCQARYAPFGQTTISSQGFILNLRLPGQYADAETGLHYNRQRYYDPERGQYLTPDPLGTPNGPNGYAYVRYNPLKYVDPDGLVLFAFDGTENSNPVLHPGVDTLSNVVEFQRRYLSDNSETRYISGVGTVDVSDRSRPILAPDGSLGHTLTPDKGFNYSGPARISRMIEYFGKEADLVDDNTAMEVDIIGFSRGAAQARDFSNQIAAKTKNGWYSYTVQDANGKDVSKCQKVDFRFMGLWDTVLSTNNSGHSYSLGIPDQFRYVSQAVALNEFRGNIFSDGRPDPTNLDSIGEFPLESIMGSPVPIGQTRIEKGFLGSHADIGGGFTNNDLSTVALAWMVQQAKDAGVTMKDEPVNIPPSAVLHDKSNNIQTGAPNPRTIFGGSEDRIVRYRDGTTTTQRTMKDTGMTFADTNEFISYADRSSLATSGGYYNRNSELVNNNIMTNVTGTVNMTNYVQWLTDHGYKLGNITVAGSK